MLPDSPLSREKELLLPDPTSYLKFSKPDHRNIYRTPLRSEVFIEYGYCFFVGIFSVALDPFEARTNLIPSMFSSLFWMIGLMVVFYKKNFILWGVSSLFTLGLWAQTSGVIMNLTNSMSGMKHSLGPTLIILMGMIGVQLGIPQGSTIKTKSFDASTSLLVATMGALVGMANRFLFHFANFPVFLHLCTVYFVVSALVPLWMLLYGRVARVKRLIWASTVLCCLCLLGVGVVWWVSDAQAAVKTQMFRAKVQNTGGVQVVLEELIQVALKAELIMPTLSEEADAGGKRKVLNDFTGINIEGVDPINFRDLQDFIFRIIIDYPKLTKLAFTSAKFVLSVIPMLFKSLVSRHWLYYPLYYCATDKVPMESLGQEISSNPGSLQALALEFAERDSLMALFVFVVLILAINVLGVWTVYKLLVPLNRLHHDTVKNVLQPVEERELVDPETYNRRIPITQAYVDALNSKLLLDPKKLTTKEKKMIVILRKAQHI